MPNRKYFNFFSDPIQLLELKGLSEREKKRLRPKLRKTLSQYVLIKLLDMLPEEIEQKDLARVNSIEELASLFRKHIPRPAEQVKQLLEDFKREYLSHYEKKF